jgi:hypothetical protein
MPARRGGEPALSAGSVPAGAGFEPVAHELPAELCEEGAVTLDSSAELQGLVAELLGERVYAVVGLASGDESGEPVLPPEEVGEIVGRRARVYFIPELDALAQLQGLLGPRLALAPGCARIWYRGLHARSSPGDHPLVATLIDESKGSALAEFARVFELSQPQVRREITLISDRAAMAEQQFDDLAGLYEKAQELLRDAHRERHEEALRADALQQRLANAAGQLEGMGCEERLHTLITQEWLWALGPDERREYPLIAHMLNLRLVATLEDEPMLAQERVAWGCAILACGYTAKAGLAPEPQITSSDGSPLTRPDGATAWQCDLPGAPTGLRLRYWQREDGILEFDSIASTEEASVK